MNLIDCIVTSIIGTPIKQYNHWWLKVAYNDMGGGGETNLMFDTFEDAQDVEIGYKFLG